MFYFIGVIFQESRYFGIVKSVLAKRSSQMAILGLVALFEDQCPMFNFSRVNAHWYTKISKTSFVKEIVSIIILYNIFG